MALLLCQAKGDTVGSCPQKLCVPIQEDLVRGFIAVVHGWNSLQPKGLSRVFSSTTVQKHQFFGAQPSSQSNSPGKTIALTRWTFFGKVMSLPYNMLSRLIITFLPRSKRLLISWLQSPSGSDFGAQKNKVSHCFHCFPIYFP